MNQIIIYKTKPSHRQIEIVEDFAYVHLESSSQLNLCLINNKFNYLAH